MEQVETKARRHSQIIVGSLIALALLLSGWAALSQWSLYSDNKKAETLIEHVEQSCTADNSTQEVRDLCDRLNNIDRGDPQPIPQVIVSAVPEVLIFEGEPGSQGPKGDTGIGIDGRNGVDGVDGTNGKDGADGTSGKDGVDGTNGADGKDGRGIHTLNFNMQDCTVDVIYSDGTTDNAIPMTGCDDPSATPTMTVTTTPGG